MDNQAPLIIFMQLTFSFSLHLQKNQNCPLFSKNDIALLLNSFSKFSPSLKTLKVSDALEEENVVKTRSKSDIDAALRYDTQAASGVPPYGIHRRNVMVWQYSDASDR